MRAERLKIEELARQAIDCGLRVHKQLGPGLLESVYETVMAASLSRHGLKVERQKPIPIVFEGLAITDAFRADIVIEDLLVVEIKSLERLAPVHSKQLLTYVRLMDLPVGLLMNFGCETFREGLKRIVNGPSAFIRTRAVPN
jgi:GxxExxY protein